MCFNAPLCGVLALVLGVLLSWPVLFPPPPLSANVEKWRLQGSYFNFKGHSIFYIDVTGSGHGVGTVIGLHGFPTFSWDWSKILPGLQVQFDRVILLDFLGFGLSDKPLAHSYSIFEQADIVTKLAVHLGVREAHLLGHDYGDTVALELLARHNTVADDGTETDSTETDGTTADGMETDGSETDGSETDGTGADGTETDGSETDGMVTDGMETDGSGADGTETDGKETDGMETDGSGPVLSLRSLAMLNGGIFTETNRPRLLQKLLLLPLLGPFLSRFSIFSLFKIGLEETFGDNKPTEEEYSDFYSAMMYHSGHQVTCSVLQYIVERHSKKVRWVGALRNSRVPVLMIYGPADPVNPPQFVQRFRQEAAQHQLVVLGSSVGHYPQWEDPESTLMHLQHFLQNLPPESDPKPPQSDPEPPQSDPEPPQSDPKPPSVPHPTVV